MYYLQNEAEVNKELIQLFSSYLQGHCSQQEIERVIRLVEQGGFEAEWREALDRLAATHDAEAIVATHADESGERIHQRIRKRIDTMGDALPRRHPRRRFALLPYTIAALLLMALTMAWLVFNSPLSNKSPFAARPALVDALPGGNRATLTLADGRTVELDEMQVGITIANDKISYRDDAQEIVALQAAPVGLAVSTPNGGTYQITLADGTQVWLNAASSIRYPSRFPDTERVVEIDGECYFSVAKDAKRPFRVRSRGQEIEVLGTEFNVSAYADDATTKTTLVAGAIQVATDGLSVRHSRRLAPGEQSTLVGGVVQVEAVEANTYIGWKNGDFTFNGMELREAMKQLSRWYDVEIVYAGDIPPTPFHGSFSRTFTLAETLAILKEGHVNFALERHGSSTRLTVSP